jgi:lysophospholipase L1-like esterase
VDYYNFGFSGNAKGDMNMAEYISGIDMSIFVYDYDHNAPSPEHLESTHEPFFKLIREKNPDLPVIMMTRPAITYTESDKRRREIVLATYQNALKAGDENVYFIDGEVFYGEHDRELCTVDKVHPNDLGFYRMAQVIEPVIKSILDKAAK